VPETVGAATAKPVDISKSSSIVTREKTVYVSKADPHRCVTVAFVLFPNVSGATGYSIRVRGKSPSHDVSGGGPPFPYDRYVVTITSTLKVAFDAPGSGHWFPVSSGASGSGCGDAEAYAKAHFSIASATATAPPGTVAPPPPTESETREPHTCSIALAGPTLGSRGERLVIVKKRGAADVISNGQTLPLAGNNRFVTGKFRIRTGPGEWVQVGEVKPNYTSTDPSGKSVLVAPGTTVEFEAGKPLRVLEWTPGLSDGTPPPKVGPYKVRTNGCVTSARG
jgi:hypothetical protein